MKPNISFIFTWDMLRYCYSNQITMLEPSSRDSRSLALVVATCVRLNGMARSLAAETTHSLTTNLRQAQPFLMEEHSRQQSHGIRNLIVPTSSWPTRSMLIWMAPRGSWTSTWTGNEQNPRYGLWYS